MDKGSEKRVVMSARRAVTETASGFHRDGGPEGAKGLYLQVSERTGGEGVTRSWIYRFVSPVTGKPRWMGLGPTGVIGLADARTLAREARKAVVLGRDPIEDRLAGRTQAKLEAARRITFEQCVDEYLAAHGDKWKNDKHRAQWETTLKKDAALLSPLPVSEIDTALVLRVLRPIWATKPETASRLRGRMERVLSFASVSEYRPKGSDNPARWRGHLQEMLPARSKVRAVKHHEALAYAELPAFMADLRSRPSMSARALEFTVLCATRTNETLGAKWGEIDLKGKIWSIPASRMKTGKPHRVPLPDRAIEVLKALPREGEFVFPGAKEGQPLSNMAMLELVRGALGNGNTVHGFRSSFRDWAAEQTAYPNHVVEMALAHIVGDKVEAAYRRGDLFDKRRRLMSEWARYCASKPVAGTGKVVSIAAARA